MQERAEEEAQEQDEGDEVTADKDDDTGMNSIVPLQVTL